MVSNRGHQFDDIDNGCGVNFCNRVHVHIQVSKRLEELRQEYDRIKKPQSTPQKTPQK